MIGQHQVGAAAAAQNVYQCLNRFDIVTADELEIAAAAEEGRRDEVARQALVDGVDVEFDRLVGMRFLIGPDERNRVIG